MKARIHSAPPNSAPAASLACAIAALLAATAQAANIYWDGGGADTLWSNVANWDTQANGLGGNPGAAPGALDTAIFNASTFNGGTGNGTLNVTFNIAANPGFSAAGMVFNNTGANTIANASGALRTVNLGSGGITLNSGAGGLSMGGTTNGTRYTVNLTAAQTWTNNGSGTCAIANAPNSSTAVVQGNFLLTLDGSGNFSFGNGINNGSGGLTKNGAGTASINQQAGLSTGTGVYTINGGILDVTIFANGGSNSGLGASSAAAGNLVFGGGTLRHSAGNVAGTDRLFTIGNAVGNTATLDSSAAAAANGLAFTGTGSILFNDTFSTTHTLTLTGSNTGAANTFAPVLGNSAGATSLTKSGAGTWAITGANTYSGLTTVSAGTLAVTGSGTLGTGSIKVSGASATLDLSGITPGSYSVGVGQTLSGIGSVALGAKTLAVAGTIAPGNSAGTLTLNGGLTLTGSYLWELAALSTANAGTDFDLLTITAGDVNITGASLGLNLGSFAPSADPFWQTQQTWSSILNNTGAGNLTGAFAAIDNSSWSSLGSFSNTYTGNDVNLVWTPVPEPTSSALAGLLLTANLLRRRRAPQ